MAPFVAQCFRDRTVQVYFSAPKYDNVSAGLTESDSINPQDLLSYAESLRERERAEGQGFSGVRLFSVSVVQMGGVGP